MRQARETGYVMGDELLKSAYDVSQGTQELSAKMEALKYNLGSGLLPVLDFFVELLNAIPTPVLIAISVFGTLASIILSVGKAVTTYRTQALLAAAANTALGVSGGTATAGLGPLLGILLAIAAVIALIVGGSAALDKALKSASQAANQAANVKPKYNAEGTDYFEGGKTWVGEKGAELVELPRGTKILSHKDSMKAARRSGGNIYVFNIQADKVKDFNHLVKLAEEERIAFRTGRVRV